MALNFDEREKANINPEESSIDDEENVADMLFDLQVKWDKVILGKAKLRQKLAHAEAKYTELLVEMKNVKQENLKLKQRIEQLKRSSRESDTKNARAVAAAEEEKRSRIEALRRETEEKKKQEEEFAKLMEAERALNVRQSQLQQLQAEKQALLQQQMQSRAEYSGSYPYPQPSAPAMGNPRPISMTPPLDSNISSPGFSQQLPSAPPPTPTVWESTQTYAIHDEPVHAIAAHYYRDIIATASWDGTCKAFDPKSTKIVQQFQGHEKGLYAVKFSRFNSDLVGTASSDNTCILWSLSDPDPQVILRGHDNEVNHLAFHYTEPKVATVSDDGLGIIWDVETGEIAAKLVGHKQPVYGVSFHPDGGLIATCAFDWTTIIWDNRDAQKIQTLQGHNDDIIGIDFDEGGYLLATGSDDSTCRIWDVRTWKCIKVLNLHKAEVKRVAFAPLGSLNAGRLATASADMSVRIWDTTTFECIANLTGHKDHVFDVAWSNKGESLYSASHDKIVRKWEPKRK